MSTRFPNSYLRQFTAEIFERAGLNAQNSAKASDVLCTADEWGIESHGLARLRAYYDMIIDGRINAKASPHVVSQTASTALIDGDGGLGLAVGPFANELALQKAESNGLSCVKVRNSNHFGIAGYYVTRGLERNIVGFAMTNTPALVSPYGGVGRLLGTNPFAIAFPAHSEPPVIIDMATSGVSLGTVEIARANGTCLSGKHLLNKRGVPTDDPEEFFKGGSLLPLGSAAGDGHKGYCLASAIDLLCGVLGGAAWGPYVPTFLNDNSVLGSSTGCGTGHIFAGLALGSAEEATRVRQTTDDWIRVMRSTQPASGAQAVLIPGDPEHRRARDSALNGVPLTEATVRSLELLGKACQVFFG